MPPQRRKIVPPTTTSKVRRKVAGTGKPTASDAGSTTAEGSDTTETTAITTPAPSTPAVDKTVADKTAADETATDKTVADKTAADKSATSKPSLAKAATKSDATEKAATPLDSVTSGASDADADQAVTSRKASGIGYKHVIVVAIIAVVLGAFAAVAAFKPFATIDNAAWVDSAATQEVTSAATDALQTLYTYKADTIDADFDAARAVLNQSMLDEFNSTADTTKSAVVQTKTGTEAMVTDIGVSRLEDDKAELIANVNISATQDGVASGSAEGPLTVNMEKVDGTWKLSAIDDQ
ncbi:hypothetical protein CH254_08590 [Rhodococcus sp. 06-412-2C]|uniref:hypothetical protein n=1 Tax=unclassified Rhodococcus (in: high G+C Gram-positive bacteria) TaxID=192944 RepID=UPI000B9AD31A|nr:MULTISPECIES: hypothetical protein [unclassified Rhodococcus (in: high G+C Gram-positive bacteria)]OZC90932.1 hypothetical protein CH254_08590 [Rhodococcus sp. 06-412-2C]OZC97814.1 hypothetical protein CH279_09400 [Rhodococcus sp. 06-412-2B]